MGRARSVSRDSLCILSRLMEHEGIYYFFKHELGKHRLVLCDGPSSHAVAEGYSTIPYYPPSPRSPRSEHIWDWKLWQEVLSVKTAHTDYDFTRPAVSLLSQLTVSRSHALAKGEMFDSPGVYQQSADGDGLSKCDWMNGALNASKSADVETRGVIFSYCKTGRCEGQSCHHVLGGTGHRNLDHPSPVAHAF